MTEERFLITGAMGCLGAWTVRELVREGTPVVAFDLSTDARRLRLIMSDDELARVTFLTGDITDLAQVVSAVETHDITYIVHLAALQIPFCRADPVRGAQVNVVGTVNVFEAAKRHSVRGLAFASSVAVYGPPSDYPPGPVAANARLNPATHYGVYKVANEGTARVYWASDGVASVCLRPHTVYGVGRDQGMTSTPTVAMLAAAAGKPYRISYGGHSLLQHARDVARAFIQAARCGQQGASVFNLGGAMCHMSEIVAAIESAAPEVKGRIAFEPTPIPYPAEFADDGIENAIGEVKYLALADGVRQTIDSFRRLIAAGKIVPPD
ncbi:MAG: NAD(P)-dependent oxidoreductase [Chloroflexi bacterium]|nr:NAD(P)-dependent oxidoreductase [Chloroflexota bacterium]